MFRVFLSGITIWARRLDRVALYQRMKPHKATEVRHHRHTNLGSGPDKSASLRQSVELCQDALPKVLCPRAIYSPLGGWDEVLRLVRAVAGIVSGFDL